MGKKEKTAQKKPAEDLAAQKRKEAEGLMRRYVNKQRTLIFSTRGITHRDRHLIQDLRDLMPHSKKDNKLDLKGKLAAVTEVCDMKNCNNCIFLEARKKKDLYMWVSKAPEGPSVKFLVQNIHTMSEVKMTGNCLKGSRPILSFDKNFDSKPEYQLMKELITQVFGSPKAHPKAKPFVDHIFSWFIVDNRIWFRNFQVVYQIDDIKQVSKDPVLVEVGPRFALNPIRIFAGSMGGPTLWQNPLYVSPNLARRATKQQKGSLYQDRMAAKQARAEHEKKYPLQVDPLSSEAVFADRQ